MATERPNSGAVFSEDRRYRLQLWRVWDDSKPMMGAVGLNPSIADATRNDPTITREIRRAAENGFGGLVKVNLYTFIATDPKDLWAAQKRGEDIVGSCGNVELQSLHLSCPTILLAWGAGAPRDRVAIALQLLTADSEEFPPAPKLVHLGLTKDGQPRHPLYVRADQPLLPWGLP